LDETKTAMGARLLKQWLDRPLIQPEENCCTTRNGSILVGQFFERADLQEALTKVYDMERLVGRVAFGNVNGRDLIAIEIFFATSTIDCPID
jgi:DNA mismatch repair protein MutS